MDYRGQDLEALLDIESRHDDLLRRLEELDERVEKVLAQWLTQREPATADG